MVALALFRACAVIGLVVFSIYALDLSVAARDYVNDRIADLRLAVAQN